MPRSHAHPCAATLEVPVTAKATISDGEGETRILVDFRDLSALTGKKILYAKCFLNIDVGTCVDVMNELEVKPLTKSWSSTSVDWVNQWDTPGGDVNESLTRTVDFQTGKDGVTEIPLTEIIQAWVDDRLTNHGLILIPRMTGCEYSLQPTSAGTRTAKLVVRLIEKTIQQ